MATRTTTTIWNNSSDANFRAWGSWLSGCFTAFGWTLAYQNFATGSNWTDVTAPAAINTARVTEVWAMADSLQSTSPLFVKIEYGANGAVARPGLRVILATGHAGSGSMTGTLHDTTATYIGPSSSNANSMTHYASGDTDRVAISMTTSGTSWANSDSMFMVIERRRNGAGTSLSTGFLFGFAAGATKTCRGFLAAAAHPATIGSWFVPNTATALSDLTFDSKVAVTPIVYCLGPAEIGLNLMAGVGTTFAVGTTLTATVLGSSHTFIATQCPVSNFNGLTGINALMRYE